MLKPERNACPICGHIMTARTEGSHIRAATMGRPKGAKGEDISWTVWACSDHGEQSPCQSPEKLADYNNWLNWIETLPTQMNEETFIDKSRAEFTDDIGNYLLSLPSRPVTNLQEWFNSHFVIPE